jgi:amino acid transporter
MNDQQGSSLSTRLEELGYRQELKRSLGVWDLLVYGLIFMVPIAPFAVFGIVFNASHGMVPLIYLVGLVAMLFTAVSYMSMSAAFPVAGSVYSYANRSMGETVGFFAGWGILLDYLLIPALTYVGCAIATNAAFPWIPKPLCVVSLVAFSTFINYLGIEATAKANIIMLVVQMIILALFTVAAVKALGRGVDGAHLALAPLYNPSQISPSLIFGALSLAVLSFLGFDAISTLAEETRGGPSAIGRATIFSLCICAVLFVGQTYLASLFVLDRISFPEGAETEAAFYTIAAKIGGASLKFLVTLPGALLSGLAGALAAQAATARLLYGMARDGQLPAFLADVDQKHKVPARAVFLVAGISLVLGILLVNQLELLTAMVSFGALLGFLILHLSVIMHFIIRQKSRRWIRHLVVPLIGFVIVAYVLLNAGKTAKLAGLGWLGVGAVALLTVHARGGRRLKNDS